MWNNLSSRNRKLLLVGGAVLVILLFYRFVWQGQYARYLEGKQQLMQRKKEIEVALRKVDRLPSLERQRARLENRLREIKRKFDRDIESGVPYVEMGLESRNRVRLAAIHPQPVVSKGSYLVLPLQLRLQGDYPSLLDYIYSIENLPSLAEINSIRITALEEELMPQLEAELNIVFYSLPEAEPAELDLEWRLGRFDIFSPALQQLVESTSTIREADTNRRPEPGEKYQPGGGEPENFKERPPESIDRDPYTFPVR
ncbi:type 4a pilus biogenesis protein PilO [Calderihabitans maritimus]|uniref:Type IV pilus assembly protein PilO n=1 Tax=Calderihabitans maritimus TaxID=1246530 RepID=A0A1Z5HXS8_9FIRM|nr:type 4a pilus biogenesis protein PilO [Calderihabitans maritimus]GAW94141.1 hypothetical protein CHY_0641 [Calderihabitans maritimus]